MPGLWWLEGIIGISRKLLCIPCTTKCVCHRWLFYVTSLSKPFTSLRKVVLPGTIDLLIFFVTEPVSHGWARTIFGSVFASKGVGNAFKIMLSGFLMTNSTGKTKNASDNWAKYVLLRNKMFTNPLKKLSCTWGSACCQVRMVREQLVQERCGWVLLTFF